MLMLSKGDGSASNLAGGNTEHDDEIIGQLFGWKDAGLRYCVAMAMMKGPLDGSERCIGWVAWIWISLTRLFMVDIVASKMHRRHRRLSSSSLCH